MNDEEHNQRYWTNETYLFIKNISLILLSKGAPLFVVIWEIDRETYTQRGDFFLSHIFFREPGDANACTPLQAVSSERFETPLICCVSLARLPILSSKSDHVVFTWSPSGYTTVGPDCPDALSCLRITTWQLVKVHGVTRNEPKIIVICYITVPVRDQSMGYINLFKMFRIR